MKKTWEDIHDLLTPEFLATLLEAGKVYGHSGDWIEVSEFIKECHYEATGSYPSNEFYEPYDYE